MFKIPSDADLNNFRRSIEQINVYARLFFAFSAALPLLRTFVPGFGLIGADSPHAMYAPSNVRDAEIDGGE